MTYDPDNIVITYTYPDGTVVTLEGYASGTVVEVEREPEEEDSSMWNGRCNDCGKGTYTGAFSVEHEGGYCGRRNK